MGKLSNCGCCCLFFVLMICALVIAAGVLVGIWFYFSPESRKNSLNDAEQAWSEVKIKIDQTFGVVKEKEEAIPPPPEEPPVPLPAVLKQ